MIVAERKPLAEILANVRTAHRLLVLGCDTCVAICLAGGAKEAEVLSTQIRLALRAENPSPVVTPGSVERQCEAEYNAPLGGNLGQFDAVLSMACGVGVQTLAEQFPNLVVYPALNTQFMGRPEELGAWSERCAGCGQCVLDRFGGVCPITRCSKNLLNGPCGGSEKGRCEVDPENLPCAWQLIYDRLERLGQMDRLLAVEPPKDWSTARFGGPRKLVRKDMVL